jgi:hypothetical protein
MVDPWLSGTTTEMDRRFEAYAGVPYLDPTSPFRYEDNRRKRGHQIVRVDETINLIKVLAAHVTDGLVKEISSQKVKEEFDRQALEQISRGDGDTYKWTGNTKKWEKRKAARGWQAGNQKQRGGAAYAIMNSMCKMTRVTKGSDGIIASKEFVYTWEHPNQYVENYFKGPSFAWKRKERRITHHIPDLSSMGIFGGGYHDFGGIF